MYIFYFTFYKWSLNLCTYDILWQYEKPYFQLYNLYKHNFHIGDILYIYIFYVYA